MSSLFSILGGMAGAVAVGIVGFLFGVAYERRRVESEKRARVNRMLADFRSEFTRPSLWLNHPLYHRNSFATIEELMPHVVEGE